jgi:outer membrane lipoprotein-sorting protein
MVITVSNTKAQRNLLNQKYVSLTEDFNIEKDQLEDYRYKGKIETFNEEKHKTKLAKKLFKSKTGKTIVFKSDYYKTKYEIISRQDIKHYRVRYIFINKNKFNTEKAFENYISKVRALLKTTAFKSVAMQYSMDYKKRVGGDSGWFKKGKTHPIFFNEVTNNSRLSEEIFEFEIPEYNGYYFVQKLWSPKDIQEILVMYTIDKK